MDAIKNLKESLWTQFGASIDMLGNAIGSADENFNNNKRFFYVAYHSLVFLDYYLTMPPDHFSASLPFTSKDTNVPPEAVDDVIPDKIYTKKEMLGYLQSSREKAFTLISSLTVEKLNERFIEDQGEDSMNYSILEILLYNMRHVQHHAAQLNMMLRQEKGTAPKWVARAVDTNKPSR